MLTKYLKFQDTFSNLVEPIRAININGFCPSSFHSGLAANIGHTVDIATHFVPSRKQPWRGRTIQLPECSIYLKSMAE